VAAESCGAGLGVRFADHVPVPQEPVPDYQSNKPNTGTAFSALHRERHRDERGTRRYVQCVSALSA
jgi:hypothetical protein